MYVLINARPFSFLIPLFSLSLSFSELSTFQRSHDNCFDNCFYARLYLRAFHIYEFRAICQHLPTRRFALIISFLWRTSRVARRLPREDIQDPRTSTHIPCLFNGTNICRLLLIYRVISTNCIALFCEMGYGNLMILRSLLRFINST